MKKYRRDEGHTTNSALLKALPSEQLDAILAKCSRRSFAKDQQIVREMDTDNNIYFVESGVLGVAQFSDSGREVGYIELKSGDNFGELSAIDGGPRSASVTAMTESEVTVMPFEVFKGLIYSNNGASVEIMRQLSGMIRRLCERIYEFSTLSVSNRIHAELLRLARKHVDLGGIARIPSPPTHAQLASRVSCNREAVSRELKRLENQGVLEKPDRRWVIPDIERLQKMVDEVHRL